MDPVTHMLIGAVTGQLVAGRKLGFAQAGVWGAVAAELPDIDVVVSAMTGGNPLDMLVHHRGVTHSLWFGPIVGALAGYLLSRSTDRPGVRSRDWMLLIGVAMLTHPLLDLCTHYGTQLLSPFSDRRFALPALPIVEPIYTAIIGIGLVLAIVAVRKGRFRRAQIAGIGALTVSTGYLLYGLALNAAAVDFARRDLVSRGANVAVIYAFPTLLQLHYRRVVARTSSEDWVGFVSMAYPCPIDWDHRPRNDSLAIEALRSSSEGRIFEWFTTGLTAAYADQRRVFLTDLRYGFVADVLRGSWRLEAELSPDAHALGTPRFVQSPRPKASVANVTQLFHEAYPSSCEKELPQLEF